MCMTSSICVETLDALRQVVYVTSLQSIRKDMLTSKAWRGVEFERWCGQVFHGVGENVFRNYPVSNGWLSLSSRTPMSQSEFILAVKTRSMTAHGQYEDGGQLWQASTGAVSDVSLSPRNLPAHRR